MSRAMGSSWVFTCWGAASWLGGCAMLVLRACVAAGAGSCVGAQGSARFGVAVLCGCSLVAVPAGGAVPGRGSGCGRWWALRWRVVCGVSRDGAGGAVMGCGAGVVVGARVHLLARRAAQALPHQPYPGAGPHQAESRTRAALPTGVSAYTRSLHRGAAEALKTRISNHQGLVHTPHDNTQEGYTLWWHHPATEGGLQPPASQPSISRDLTAVPHAVTAIAQQVGAPPQWAQSVVKETAACHNQVFTHFRGRPIHPPLPDLNLPAQGAWAVHILVPHHTSPKTGDATARVTKQLPNTAFHYDIPTPNVIVTHNMGHDHYYLHATHERSPITIYTFTTYPGLQPPRHLPRQAGKHPLHVAPTPSKRPAHHAPPPADSTGLDAARGRAAAQDQKNLLPRISTGPGTVTEATHKRTSNLLARKLRPKMAQ